MIGMVRLHSGRVLGVGVDAERIQILVADLGGSVIGVRDLPSPAARGGKDKEPGQALARRVAEAASELLGGVSPATAGVIGVGLGVTGRVGPGNRRIA